MDRRVCKILNLLRRVCICNGGAASVHVQPITQPSQLSKKKFHSITLFYNLYEKSVSVASLGSF